MIKVEMVGLPASGKTTLRKAIEARAHGRDLRVVTLDLAVAEALRTGARDPLTRIALRLLPRRRHRPAIPWQLYARSLDRMRSAVEFSAEHPQLLELIARGLSMPDRDPRVPRAETLRKYLDVCARFHLAAGRLGPDDVLVAEGGFCQRLRTFARGDGSMDPAFMDAYLDACPRPEVVVALPVTRDLAAGRLTDRGGRWLGRLDRVDRAVEVADRYIELLQRQLRARGVEVLVPDPPFDPAELADRVLDTAEGIVARNAAAR